MGLARLPLPAKFQHVRDRMLEKERKDGAINHKS